MKVRFSKQWAAAAALSAAVVVGAASPVSAAPSPDALAPSTGSLAGTERVDVAAPQGSSGQALLAARGAGIPIYEAAQVLEFRSRKSTGPNSGPYQMTEYRRVWDFNVLSSPTPKFVTVGAVLPDTFYQYANSGVPPRKMLANPRLDESGYTVWDDVPGEFRPSATVQLPGGGPTIGFAVAK